MEKDRCTPLLHPSLTQRDRQAGPMGQPAPPVSRTRSDLVVDRRQLAADEAGGQTVTPNTFYVTNRTRWAREQGHWLTDVSSPVAMAGGGPAWWRRRPFWQRQGE
jgi:hypothetical protein